MTASPRWPTGLYAVTPDEVDTDRLLTLTEAVLRGGATTLQYRHKTATRELALEQARELRALTRRHGAWLVINDHVDLARSVEADGIHVGHTDRSIAALREELGDSMCLGASCYGSLERVAEMAEAGADYVALGGFYASRVKKYPVTTPLSAIGDARRHGLPVVVIGGITADNAAPLVEAGADAIAVISGLYATPDPEAAARRLCGLFTV